MLWAGRKTQCPDDTLARLNRDQVDEHARKRGESGYNDEANASLECALSLVIVSPALDELQAASLANGGPRWDGSRQVAAMLRHKRQTVAMALAEASHHSAPYSGPRTQKAASAKVDPTCIDWF